MAPSPEQPPASQRAEHVLLQAAAFLIAPAALAWALTYLSVVLVPLCTAIFLLFVLSPPARALQRLGLSELWAYFLTALGAIAGVVLFGVLLYAGLGDLEDRMPSYVERFRGMTETWLRGTTLGNRLWEEGQASSFLQDAPSVFVRWSFGSILGVIGGFVAMTFYLVFLLLEQHTFPARLRGAFPNGGVGDGRKIAEHLEADVRTYIWVKTMVSVGTGITTALGLALVGVDFWLVWGLLAFAFNYIPYIGSFVASLPPIIIAFVQFGFGWGSWLTLGVLLLNQLVWDNFLTPRLEGQRLDLSPLLIVVGLAYFGLVWGVIGMALTVPLMLGVRELLLRFESTRALAKLMCTGAKPKQRAAA